MQNMEGLKTSEFYMLAGTTALAYIFGHTMDPMILASTVIGAGLYAVGRGVSKGKSQ